MNRPRIGSSFESFLTETGMGGEVRDIAQRRVLAWQIDEERTRIGLSKSEMAKRMGTSRRQVDRLLDPSNDRLRMDTLAKAARAVGRELRVKLV